MVYRYCTIILVQWLSDYNLLIKATQASKMIHSYEKLIAHQYEMSTPFNSTLVRIPYPPCRGIAICSLICPGNAKHTVGSTWLCRMENMQDSIPTGHRGVNFLMVWPYLMGRAETVTWRGVNVASQSSGLGSTALASPSKMAGPLYETKWGDKRLRWCPPLECLWPL